MPLRKFGYREKSKPLKTIDTHLSNLRKLCHKTKHVSVSFTYYGDLDENGLGHEYVVAFVNTGDLKTSNSFTTWNEEYRPEGMKKLREYIDSLKDGDAE